MSLTTGKGIVYPESSDNTRLWEWFQQMAASADGIIIGGADVQVFTASGTWTRPAGAIFTVVEVQGGGGGGGGAASTGAGAASCGGGGGGGEFARGAFSAATTGTSQAVTVGPGGTTGPAGGTGTGQAGTGGTSSFGALVTAIGGAGGDGGSSSTTNFAGGVGGLGGTGGTGGDWRIPGGEGCNGMVIGGVAVKHNNGGDSHLAGVTRATSVLNTPSTGRDGRTYGGGGSGGSNGASGTATVGSAGGAGVVIVTTYKA